MTRLAHHLLACGFANLTACTAASLHVPGDPVGCDPMGGVVMGDLIDPAGASTRFGAVTATFDAPDLVTLTDGTLSLILTISDTPREISLVFPGRPVFATTGKLVVDEDTTCHAGRYDVFFQYHGQLNGWFAVP
jgi:hypothetical protein